LVSLKTQSAGDDYPKKEIEKTVLRFLGSRTFSHGLDPFRTFALPLKNPDACTAPTCSSGPDPLRLHCANSVRNERTEITARAAALREGASARQGRGQLGDTL
jgi:hypothetical protein